MRLPNGYGSVCKLSGKRRNPSESEKTLGYELTETEEPNRFIRPSVIIPHEKQPSKPCRV